MEFQAHLPKRAGLVAVMGVLLLCAACAKPGAEMATRNQTGLDQARLNHAVTQAKAMRSAGQRVWCVPFARNATGIDIRGNAETWWDQAAGTYHRGHEPALGAVMAFAGTRALPMGHVAVVSQIVSDREIRVDHANWLRNQVSLGMSVIDVSDAGDWSRVRVESTPGNYGKVYVIDGYIYGGDQAL